MKLMPCIVTALLLLGGCSTRTARVATDAVFPPFHYVDEDGSLRGYDIEVAREALLRAGVAAEFERGESFAALYDGLKARRYDVIAATTGITPERQERYGFTRPYFVTCLGILVRSGPNEPRTPDDLAGRAVAASAGTTSAAAAHRIEGVTVLETSRWRDSLAALRAREVDAVIIDEFEAVPFARDAADLEVLPDPIATESYGLVLRLGDVTLREKLNEALDDMEADGSLTHLRAQYGLDRPADWPIRLPE